MIIDNDIDTLILWYRGLSPASRVVFAIWLRTGRRQWLLRLWSLFFAEQGERLAQIAGTKSAD